MGPGSFGGSEVVGHLPVGFDLDLEQEPLVVATALSLLEERHSECCPDQQLGYPLWFQKTTYPSQVLSPVVGLETP